MQDFFFSPSKDMMDLFKNWMMVTLTLIFVAFYIAALLGWLKPLSEVTIVTRLEPLLFVIIGYYFGRLPVQQHEKSCKEEINRQTLRAEAAQNAKEQAFQMSEVLEEKIKNAVLILTGSLTEFSVDQVSHQQKKPNPRDHTGVVHHSIETALSILNS